MDKPAYQFLPGTTYDEFGHCLFAHGDFVTMLHTTPCTAWICNAMDHNGWILYTQPRDYRANFFNVGNTSYIATYVKRNRSSEPTAPPPEMPCPVDH